MSSTLAELFRRDPLKMTREDRAEIIAKLRDGRLAYVKSNVGTKDPAKASDGEKLVAELNLDIKL